MANDNWQTPQNIYEAFNERFKFCIDLAASPDNAKCESFLSMETDNALFYNDWASRIENAGGDFGWLNPPYSNPKPFVEIAIATQKAGKGVVMLLNNDPSVYWYKIAIDSCSEVWHFTSNTEYPRTKGYRNGRIAFIDGSTGKPSDQNNKPQCAFVFNPHRVGEQQTRYIELASFQRKGDLIIENGNKND